jgi:Predicted metal-binding protein
MKFRRNKVKREHGLIQNALPWLENLSLLSEVTDIIPGVIDVSHSSERGVVYKYKTRTGCKLLLKSNGSIQEVFVVTKNPACVEEWIKTQFPSDSCLPTCSEQEQNENKSSFSKKKMTNKIRKSKESLENKPPKKSNGTQIHSKKRPYGGVKNINKEKRDVKIADQLDHTTKKALSHLKKSLQSPKSMIMTPKIQKHRKDSQW